MRVLVPSLVAVALLAAGPDAKIALAHGGQYRGPAGEVPPDSRNPEDPPPPDTGGTGTPTPPDTGGPGTPTPPDTGGPGTPTPPDPGTPDSPGTGNGPPPTGPGGPHTKTKPSPRHSVSYESWLFWWNYNKDEILDLRQAMRAGKLHSGSDALTDIAGPDGVDQQAQDLTTRAIENQVVPLLKEIASDSKANFDIQSAAVLGLAKIGRIEEIGLFEEMASNAGPVKYAVQVEESAALALGILQERGAPVREFLGRAANDRAARTRTRCFAAFALGLLGTPDAAAGTDAVSLGFLRTMATSPAESSREITASAFVGIGHLGDPAAIPDLLRWLKEEKAGPNRLDDLELSYVAAALGKIGRAGSGPGNPRDVLDAMRDRIRLRSRLTRYSAVIALGQIGSNADEKVRRECVDILSGIAASEGKGGIDVQTVNLALTSLGRAAGAGAGEAVRARAIERLVTALEGRAAGRPFAALGLGLALMGTEGSQRNDAADKLGAILSRLTGDVEERGAYCIALGLLRDMGSADQLLDILKDRSADRRLRGTAAIGLGLIGDRRALPTIHEVLDRKDFGEMRLDAALAAGLLRDEKVVGSLVAILREPKASQVVLGSAATALGQIGDQNAVEPLATILRGDRVYTDLTRALACVALGQMGDRSRTPVLSRLSKDVNYRAYFDAIGEVLTIL